MWKKMLVMGLAKVLRPMIEKSFKNSEFLKYELAGFDRVVDIIDIMTDDDKDNSAQLNHYIEQNKATFGRHVGEFIQDVYDKDKESSFTE